MAAAAAPSAEELQQALAANLHRLRSAANYLERLARSDDPDAAFEIVECWARVDVLLDERNALRARR